MTARRIRFERWTDDELHGSGFRDGTAATTGGVRISHATGTLTRRDEFLGVTHGYEYARWTSPVADPGFGATEIVPSWTADTPGRTWIEAELRATTSDGVWTPWHGLGQWARRDDEIRRTSARSATVDTDTLAAPEGTTFTSWQIRITLYRPEGTGGTPVLRSAGAVASAVPRDRIPATEPAVPGPAWGTTLDVPRYSQKVHSGEYPQWDNGGESWCSPTSVSMIAAYWGTGPTAADIAWVDPAYPDPPVCHAARGTYDYTYKGCGNWPFNAAYAGTLGLDAFVTRLRSFTEVESFITAGVPLVVSASYAAGEVPGATYQTGGHLLIVAGFTETGDVVVNDPAAVTNEAVRKVFGRREFEAAWLAGSGGITYVIRPAGTALPPAPAEPNW